MLYRADRITADTNKKTYIIAVRTRLYSRRRQDIEFAKESVLVVVTSIQNKQNIAIITKHVAVRKLKYKKYPTWFSIELIKCLKQKNSEHNKFKKKGMVQHYKNLLLFRKKAKMLL